MLSCSRVAGCLVEIVLSQFVHKLDRIITPTVTGIVITVIGFSLIKVGFADFAGGAQAGESPGNPINLLLFSIVVVTILTLTFNGNPMVRISAIMIGLALGFIAAAVFGQVIFSNFGTAPLFALPAPLKSGLDFDIFLFIPIAFIYLVTAIESSGDLTVNSVISGEPVEGKLYKKRIKGGILGDGVEKFATDSVHYIHLADPSEEGIGNCEEPMISTLSIEENPLVTKLTLMASRGRITSEEHAQLAVFVIDR